MATKSSGVVRINLSLPPETLRILDELTEKEHSNRSQLVVRLVGEAVRRQKLHDHIEAVRAYYADPECRAFEENLCEEWEHANAPLAPEEWPDAPQ